MKKILEIDRCFDCPHFRTFGLEEECLELGRKLRSLTGRIPKDCPLPSAENIIIVEKQRHQKYGVNSKK